MPRLYLWGTLIWSRHKTSVSTRTGYNVDEGRVVSRRWEWGIGKGQWRRRAKKHARMFGMRGRARAVYFLVGAYYRLEYTGSGHAANSLYEAII